MKFPDSYPSPLYSTKSVRRQLILDDDVDALCSDISVAGDDLILDDDRKGINLDMNSNSFPSLIEDDTISSPRNRSVSTTMESPVASPSPRRIKTVETNFGLNSFTIGSGKMSEQLRQINSKLNSKDSPGIYEYTSTEDETSLSPLKSPLLSNRVFRLHNQKSPAKQILSPLPQDSKTKNSRVTENQKENTPPHATVT